MRLFISGGRHQGTFTSIIQVVASLRQLRQPFCAVLAKCLCLFLTPRPRSLFTAQLVCRSPVYSEDYRGSGTRFGVGRPLGE